MEIFVRTIQNYTDDGISIKDHSKDIYIDRKLSLFGDEEIELTRNWYDQQIISGYGSWSKTISIPIDANNNEIFKFYDVIGGAMINYSATTVNEIDPNYLLKARLVINDFEIQGNLQVVGFSMKQMVPFSYQVIFYGGEKNLILDLNASTGHSTLNDIDTTNLKFTFTKENVINSWSATGSTFFVPLFAIRRPLNYRDYELSGNTNSAYSDGFRMTDLAVAYNVEELLNILFNNIVVPGNNGEPLRITHEQNVKNFLKDLYIMPNTRLENTTNITYINTKNVGSTGLLALQPGVDTTTGILVGNTDLISYNNITGYTISNNEYTAQVEDTYNINLNYNAEGNGLYVIQGFRYVYFEVIDVTTTKKIAQGNSVYAKDSIDIAVKLAAGQKIKIYIYYVTSENPRSYYVTNNKFQDKGVNCKIKFTQISEVAYGYEKSTINFPSNVLLSDFFVNFCKTFNIFFLYEAPPGGGAKTIKTYFKNELPANNNDRSLSLTSEDYDLSRWQILDTDVTFNHQPKYKLIDYSFAEPKDINNLAWFQGKGILGTSGDTKVSNSLWFGENKKFYNYDVGLDKLEYKSIFTVFPKTYLNKTDSDNNVIDNTGIPLHSELNETFNPLNTDYLLMYRNTMITGLTYQYHLQNSALTYDVMDYCSNYGPDGENGYSLDYIQLPLVIKDNEVKRYEGTLEFLLPFNILYNLKVYDIITVRGVQYEILDMNLNMSTGYSKIKVQTQILNPNKVRVATPIAPVVTETTTRIPCIPHTLQLVIARVSCNTNITYFNVEKNGICIVSGTSIDCYNPIVNYYDIYTGDLITATVTQDCDFTGSTLTKAINSIFLPNSPNSGSSSQQQITCPINTLTFSGYTIGDSVLDLYTTTIGTTTTTTTLAPTTTTTLAPTTTTTTTCSEILYTGQTAQGGIVFYVWSGGTNGYIASLTDAGTQGWGCYGSLLGATGSTIGSGKQNTQQISSLCSTSAASLCTGSTILGYIDWFLPSKDEFTEMNKLSTELSLSGGYWESTEATAEQAYVGGATQSKFNNNKIRPIREFSNPCLTTTTTTT